MLCDSLLANGANASGVDIGPLIPRLKAAQKFVLGPEFAAVAEALSEDFAGLVKVFSRCRLPYRETWIEVAQADRPRFMAAGIHIPEAQMRPKRVGFLLSATRADLSAWKTHLFWCFDNDACGVAMAATSFDMDKEIHHYLTLPSDDELSQQRVEWGVFKKQLHSHPGWAHASADTKLILTNHTSPDLPDFSLYFHGMETLSPPEIATYMRAAMELSHSDWAGEATYLLAVIGLLNAKNAVETEHVDQSKLNKARIKNGKLPLFEHKILKIARRQVERVYKDGRKDLGFIKMRGHMVRGHFKQRATGIYFWHPFARGDFSRGRVVKDYELD